MIYTGDSLHVLRCLPDSSVHCCVTSPPYFGLRDYGTAKWKGGKSDCKHTRTINPRHQRPSGLFHGGSVEGNASREAAYKDVCGKCGARRVDQQIGLERTPSEYVARMVELFREVRRVLRPAGSLWLNLGDSYANAGLPGPNSNLKACADKFAPRLNPRTVNQDEDGLISRPRKSIAIGLKPKDLIGIPWRVAFALQADGWYLRSDIIWHKPNPMPESVTDRPTKAHEYMFLLSKQAKYYYDAEAIKEPSIRAGSRNNAVPQNAAYAMHRVIQVAEFRNRRTVWTVSTKPYKGAHFATFPPKLIEPCILAGCPEGGTVLDPFAGAFTTGLVAQQHNRNFIGIELNPEYVRMGRERMAAAEPKRMAA